MYHCNETCALYKRCVKSMQRPKFRPPQLPHSLTELSESYSRAKKDILDMTGQATFGRRGMTKKSAK